MLSHSSRRHLLPALALAFLLAFSAAMIATAEEPPVRYRLWTMNADGSQKTVLFENAISQFTHPHPSPDGSLIAGVVYTADLSGDGLRTEDDLFASAIALIDADGSNFRILTDVPGEVDSHPAWSPDGSKLLFTSSQGSTIPLLWDLYTINVDGTNRQKLTDTPWISEGDPHWGDDGRIAFIRGALIEVLRGKPAQVHTMNADGSGLAQVSHVKPGGETIIGFATGPYDPVLSPSGDQIVWSQVPSDLSGASQVADFDITVADAGGDAPVDLSQNPFPDLMPRWSPDGSLLVFWILFGREGNMPVGDDIYIIQPDGSGRTNLTLDFDEVASMPDWLPDGRILFTSVADVNPARPEP